MRNMFLLLSATLFMGSHSTFAQRDSSGIFNTADDYKNGKLTYAVNYKTEKNKIKDHLFLDETQVKVKQEGQLYLLDKRDIYGYRDTKGRDFRFVGGSTFRVLNPGEHLLLYEQSTKVREVKSVPTIIDKYYFSTDVAGPVVRLTRENLKKAFPENVKFHESLDRNFRNDEDLIGYDKVLKRYKLNEYLDNSMRQY